MTPGRTSVSELASQLRQELNRYALNEKLPSSRALVARYRVSPVTVSRAIALLAAEGLVVARPGAGVFAAPGRSPAAAAGDTSWQELTLSAEPGLAPERAVHAASLITSLTQAEPGVIDLNSGYLHPSLQPERLLATALSRAGRRPGSWTRPPLEGLAELRAWFARDIAEDLSAADVLITAGGQCALTTALRSLAAPGAPLLVESPTYPGLIAIARAAGLRPVPVPVDADGVRTDLLAEAFAVTGARLFVCQPLFQNPTGCVLSPQRRDQVRAIARQVGAFVIEDDFAGRLVHADAPPVPLPMAAGDQDGVVVHIRTLTKPSSPSLRVAALAARGPALARMRAMHTVDSFFVPRPMQEATLELVAAPEWPRHLRALSAALQHRRTALAASVDQLTPGLLPARLPYGGYHLWLRLPDGLDPDAVAAAALRTGVAITPGSAYFTAEPPAPCIRLSYSHAESAEQLRDGARRFSQALDTLGAL
jgi:DNA-binding transcriptional MocR family regulator